MMKRNLVGFLMFILFVACHKDDNLSNQNDSNINTVAVKQVISSENEDLQRNLFRLLTPSEKVAVWKNKYKELLIGTALNREQRLFVEKIEKLITIDFFSQGTQRLKINELKESAITLFGVSGAYYLGSSIKNESFVENTIRSNDTIQSLSSNECKCSSVDDWCSYLSTCSGRNCTYSSSGCGWWWGYSCNGTCVDHTWH